MLPDIPKLKNRLYELLMLALEQERFQASPILSMTPKHPIMEGNKAFLVREDGVREEIRMKHSESSIEYDIRDISKLTIDEMYQRYRDAIQKIVVEQHAHYLQELEEAVQKVGNVVDAKGKEPSPDIILEAFEKISVDFDELGRPRWPTLIVGGEMEEKMKQIQDQFDREPYKSQWELLVEKKREEWRARESRRTLVD